MCRQVKSIEIIEFGYEKSEEGVNGAKTEYCIDKHKLSMTRPYQARAARGHRQPPGRRRLRAMYDRWLGALQELTWKPGETDEQYKERVAQPYQDFKERAEVVRTALASGAKPATAEPASAKAKPAAKTKTAEAPAARKARTDPPARRGPGGVRAAIGAPATRRDRAPRARPRSRRHLRRRRRARPDAPGFPPPPAATGDGRGRRAAIATRGALIAEAGTGTGKTFAYLVPALLYGGKVIVSTGTKTLQDQLYQRDLPLVRDALGSPVTLALLKGRANYVCHHHLERAAADGRLPSRDDARHLPKIVAFAHASESGDRGELADVPENATIWPLVTSTRDNCLGGDCGFFGDCFVMKARKEALEADVVVVNHHLFFADVMLRDEGLAELLPACNTMILDEAHQLPDTATLFFGEQMTAGALAELARDAEVAARTGAREVPDLPDAAADLGPAIRKLRLALGRRRRQARPERRRAARRLPAGARRAGRPRSTAWRPSSASSPSAARTWPPSPAAPASCRRRCAAGAAGLAGGGGARASERRARTTTRPIAPPGDDRRAAPRPPIPRALDPLDRRDAAGLPAARVAAVGRGHLLAAGRGTPAARGSSRRRRWRSPATSRSTSASWGSPTPPPAAGSPRSTTRRRRCCTCRAACRSPTRASTPRRSSPRRCRCCARAAAARSCCSRRCARSTSRASSSPRRSPREDLPWPLLVQGEGAKTELLVRFREPGNAVLLGSASFWEGVDVPGDALSVVVIDKLPFAPPDDPLLAARLEHLSGRAATRSSTSSCRRRRSA